MTRILELRLLSLIALSWFIKFNMMTRILNFSFFSQLFFLFGSSDDIWKERILRNKSEIFKKKIYPKFRQNIKLGIIIKLWNLLTLFLRLPLCCCLPPGIWGGNQNSESFVIIPLLCDHFLFWDNLYFKTLMCLCIRGLLWCLWGPHRCLSPQCEGLWAFHGLQ